ncbi:hypothetical protein D918_08017, partial [Trichuris suis]
LRVNATSLRQKAASAWSTARASALKCGKTQHYSMPFRGFIRGCYDSMLVQGFNQTIVRWYRWLHRDSCHFYNKQEVLQLPFKDRESRDRHDNSPNQMLHICTCYSHGCNGAYSLSAAAVHWSKGCNFGAVPPILTVLCLSLVKIWNNLNK